MSSFFRNEFKNAITLYYLLKLDKKVPTDHDMIRKRQGRKIYKLMKKNVLLR